LPQALILKGAVMDQKWGTTQNVYRDSQSSTHKKGGISKDTDHMFYEQRLSNSEWINILKRYVKSVHNVGLSTLATYRPRWVIANVHPSAGLCNRIVNILASMAFAMATGLLFDWNKMDPFLHVDGKEWMSSSNMEDFFAPLPFAYSLQDAKDKFGTFYEQNKANVYVVEHADISFLHDLLNVDLDVKYPHSIIIMNRYDWWATPLFENAFYKKKQYGLLVQLQVKKSFQIYSNLFLHPKFNIHLKSVIGLFNIEVIGIGLQPL
jgi:hypothetical protein